MIISHSRRFIFIKSTKTAGTSLEAALSNYCSGEDVVTELGDYRHNRDENGNWVHRAMNTAGYEQEEPALSVHAKVGEEIWNAYYKFSIARNPWDRAVSSFCWHSRNDRRPQKRLLDLLRVPLDEMVETRRRFARFVKDELKTNDRFYIIDGELCVDFVIRYEDLSKDFDQVCSHIGLPPAKLPHLKAGIRKGGHHYSEYFDAETRALIEQRHRHDICLFGYRFEEC